MLAHNLFLPTTNFKAEYGVEYSSYALPMQGEGGKRKIKPVVRLHIVAAVPVVQSRGCETKKAKKRKRKKTKSKKDNIVLYSHPVGIHFKECILLLLGSYLYLYN